MVTGTVLANGNVFVIIGNFTTAQPSMVTSMPPFVTKDTRAPGRAALCEVTGYVEDGD